MTADEIIARLAHCQQRLKQLERDNQRLTELAGYWERKHGEVASSVRWLTRSRANWRRKALVNSKENRSLRDNVRWLTVSRDNWRAKALKNAVRRRSRVEPNVWLSRSEVDRIMRMPVRD